MLWNLKDTLVILYQSASEGVLHCSIPRAAKSQLDRPASEFHRCARNEILDRSMELTVHLVLVVLQLQRSCFTLVRSSTSMAGVFKSQTFVKEDLPARNFFAQPMSDSYGYAKAFLFMIYA